MSKSAYTRDQVAAFLRDYQRLALGARMAPREESLGTRPPPLGEAPWAASSRMRADIEAALSRLPFTQVQITFMALAMGGSDWASRRKSNTSWREKVADWWGISAGEVSACVGATLDGAVRELSGVERATEPLMHLPP